MIRNQKTASHPFYQPNQRAPRETRGARLPSGPGKNASAACRGTLAERCEWMRRRQVAKAREQMLARMSNAQKSRWAKKTEAES